MLINPLVITTSAKMPELIKCRRQRRNFPYFTPNKIATVCPSNKLFKNFIHSANLTTKLQTLSELLILFGAF